MGVLNTWRDTCYLLLVVSTFCICVLVHCLKLSHKTKKYVFSICGFTQVVIFCGVDTLHFVIMVCVGTAMAKSRTNPRLLFVYCLAHRVFFSSSAFFGFERNENNLANALMLVTTVKMITVGYEAVATKESIRNRSKVETIKAMTNGHVTENGEKHGRKREMLMMEEPISTLDILCYMTSFIGLFTGPLFRYKTYHDMLDTPNTRSYRTQLVAKFKIFIAVFVTFLIGNYLLDPNYIKEDAFYEAGLGHRLLWIVPIIVVFQIKYSVIWVVMEMFYILVGLGAYPETSEPRPGHGPTKLENGRLNMSEDTEFDFNTITNMHPMSVIMEKTFRGTFYSWNCCVQWWLAHFVYSSTLFPRCVLVKLGFSTMFINAIWHGVKPGYYVSFPAVPMIAVCEEICNRNIRDRLQSGWLKNLYELFHWITFKLFCFSFLFSSFMLLQWDSILRLYKSLYFYGYIFPIVMALLSFVIAKIIPHSGKTLKVA
ncbi:membrane-bound acylglycerophosphatidylinositol O-acyltransferase mboat7-like [Ciona intestinalis]